MMVKKILYRLLILISSFHRGLFAGKMIGFLDFCRKVICENKETFAGQIHERMKLYNLLPESSSDGVIDNNTIVATDKIKVRIVYPSGCSWNNIHTLYSAFMEDERFQTYVLVRKEIRFINIMKKVGCSYIILDDYDLRVDRPDILIVTSYSSSDPEISFPQCRFFVKKIYSVFPNAVMNEKDDEIHWKYVSNAYKYLNPDYYIVDPLPYNSLIKYIPSEKLIKLGNPQFDEIYNEVGKNHSIPKNWDKLRGKKVFLWATDHGINESYPKNGFTIDLYLGKMIRYFSEHEELGLIFRPHPEFIREMLHGGHFWTNDDIQCIKDYMFTSPNMIWDDTYDYCCAYDICDALIVDINCSITVTFLTTGKPICRLKRYDIEEWLISPELYDSYYYANNMDECVEFINNICVGIDPKKELRKSAFKKAILYFDGCNGQRIKKYIVEDYLNDYSIKKV